MFSLHIYVVQPLCFKNQNRKPVVIFCVRFVSDLVGNPEDGFSHDAAQILNCQQYLTMQFHYENTPMQYTAIYHGCKNENFQMKNCDIFLIVAQNIDRGYTLEPPQ